jgi:hypothetical protein
MILAMKKLLQASYWLGSALPAGMVQVKWEHGLIE